MTKRTSKAKAKQTTPPDATEEWWTVVRVASFMHLNYQTARNRMLSGVFGRSQYDPHNRSLTVEAAKVRAVRSEERAATADEKARRR